MATNGLSGTVGLSNVMYSVLSYDQTGKATYGTPKKLAPAVQAKITQNVDQQVQYADDAAVEISQADGEIQVDFTALDIPTATLAEILGKKRDSNGVMLSGANDTPPYVALMFKSLKSNGKYRFVTLYKGRFASPDEDYQTKQGKADMQNVSISGMFVKRDADDIMKARVDEDDDGIGVAVVSSWFTKPYEPMLPTS